MPIFFLTLLLIFIDQISKFFVVSFLKDTPPLVIIENFLNFFYLENRGAAFGIFQGNMILFSIITILVLGFLIIFLIKNYRKSSIVLKTSIALIIGGAVGNFIDRIRLNYVVDFISFKIFGRDFAVFNFADCFIVIGTFLLMLMLIFHENPPLKKVDENKWKKN